MPENYVGEAHQHPWGQLAYASKGIMKVATPGASFIIPPQKAVWLPRYTPHTMSSRFGISFRSLYLHNSWTRKLPEVATVINVNCLLRELILEAASWIEQTLSEQQERLVSVLIDQVEMAKEAPLFLKVPTDKRLLQIANRLMSDPADSLSLESWSRGIGATSRTLNRLFVKETQMGFVEWRQRLRILYSLDRLERGENVAAIALDLGYESDSAFITMFKKHLGVSPKKYFKQIETKPVSTISPPEVAI